MTTNPIPYSDVAARVESRPLGGAHRRDCDPIIGGDARGGKHKDEHSIDGLLLDAYEAAAVIAGYSETWSAEQVLVHAEIAHLAIAEAHQAVSVAPEKPARRGFMGRRDKNDAPDKDERDAGVVLAAQVLTEAHAQLTFIDA